MSKLMMNLKKRIAAEEQYGAFRLELQLMNDLIEASWGRTIKLNNTYGRVKGATLSRRKHRSSINEDSSTESISPYDPDDGGYVVHLSSMF